MPQMMPQVALHRIIAEGMTELRNNLGILDDIFQYYTCAEMNVDYGQPYIDKIKEWFDTTKIPVVQAWSLNPQLAPQISIRLATESEDESKAAIGDHFGMGEEANVGVNVFITQLDVGIHASRNGDETLWLYYIISYILFKRKRRAEALGLQLTTFSATDYTRDAQKLADNIFSRYIRLRAVVQNFWAAEDYLDFEDVGIDLNASSVGSDDEVDI
jgi:hypothetical protein